MQIQTKLGAALLPLLTALVALGQLSIDLYLPSLPSLASDLAIPPEEAQLTLSSFLLGFAAANIFHGPLSDRFGRRPVLLGGLVLYGFTTVLMIVTADFHWLIGARLFQAIGSCAASVACRAIVRDVYGAEGASKAMSYLVAGGSVALAIGPMLGGLIAELGGWRYNFGLLGLYGFVSLVLAALFLPETCPEPRAKFSLGSMAATYGKLLSHPQFVGNALCATFGYSGIFFYLSASSFVLVDQLGLEPSLYGLGFGILVMGFISGAMLSARLNNRLGPIRLVGVGAILAVVASGSLLVSVSIEPSAIGIFAPIFFYEMAVGLSLPNAQGRAIGPFPQSAGAASSLIGLMQTGVAALFGALLGHVASLEAVPMAVAMVFSAILLGLAHLITVRAEGKVSTQEKAVASA